VESTSTLLKNYDKQSLSLSNAVVNFNAAVQKRESHGSPSMEYHGVFMEQTDEQLFSWNDDDVDFNADVQKREELLVQPIPGAEDNHLQSMGKIPEIRSATTITIGTEEAEDNYLNFDSTCSNVLTSRMLNCREVEEHVVQIMQVESGAQMGPTHKCKKTYYCAGPDGSIPAPEIDVHIASATQDLIGGRAASNGLGPQVILDKNSNICGIYPLANCVLLNTPFLLLVMTAV
jgi:hypothetical protein